MLQLALMERKPWGSSFNDAKSAIFLYLALKGIDYPYHIHKFFKESGLCLIDGLKTLNHPNKVSTLLREMEKNNLVFEKSSEEKNKNLASGRGHDRIFYGINPNVIYLQFNYILSDSEIQELYERDKKVCFEAFESGTKWLNIRKFDWVTDGAACPECRERYVAMNCWKKKKEGTCWINRTKECRDLSSDENNHFSCDALVRSNNSTPHKDITDANVEHNQEYRYRENPLPALIYEYCEPDKVFPISRHDENEWSETLFTQNFIFSDEEIKDVLLKINKFDYLTILLVVRDLLHHIIFSIEEGSIDIGSADVESSVRCMDFPSDVEARQKIIEELIDWKIFYKEFSRKYQINKIIMDIKEREENSNSSPSVLFNFMSYERTINSDRTDFEIPHMLLNNEIYKNLMVGINQLISKNLMDERIMERTHWPF